MTRRSDLMLEDLFGCDHTPEIPVTDGGEIVHWLCRCGKKVNVPNKAEGSEVKDDDADPMGG